MNPLPDATLRDAVGAAAVIRLDGVSAGYSGGPDILTDVTLHANGGDCLVVTGAPGTGKTTLLRLLHAALTPRRGDAVLLGLAVRGATGLQRAALRRRMGFVAHAPAMVAHATTLANVALAAAPADRKAPADAGATQNARDLLHYLGLAAREERPASLLSPSERRLAALARAVLVRPAILLADDPLAGLAPDLQTRVLRLLAQIARQGGAVVVTCQAAEAYAPLGGVVDRLAGGRLAAMAS